MVVAWAGACIRDQFGRPVAGAINICPDTLQDLAADRWSMLENVVLHELLHVLVFSKDNMKHFVDRRGRQIAFEKTVHADVNGIEYVVSPQVRRATREHFGCDDVHGAILEPRGGQGTAGNHWMLNWHGELMGPVVFNNVGYLSAITCALFKDSGHYAVDEAQCAQPWRFGFRQGCDFFFAQCADGSAQRPFFCGEGYENGCSWDGLSLASCRSIDQETIPLDDAFRESNLNLDICPFEEAHYRMSLRNEVSLLFLNSRCASHRIRIERAFMRRRRGHEPTVHPNGARERYRRR